MEVVVEFDYIAQNIDEIDIKKGDRIRNVVQREEGWYEGELISNGKTGLFPDNFVKTIKNPPPAMISKNLPHPPGSGNQKAVKSGGIPTIQQQHPPSTPVTPPPSILQSIHQQQQQQQQKINQHHHQQQQMPIKQQMNSKPVKPVSPNNNERYKARVLYSYIPVNEDELAIQENEIVDVIRLVEDGWFEGTFMGKQGVFPSNYVERVITPTIVTEVAPAAEALPKSNLLADKTPSYNENSVESDLDKSTTSSTKKNKKVLGIGFGNIFSGKQIELKTKENFSNQKNNTLTIDHHSERHSERQIADSIMQRNDPEAAYLANEATKPLRIKAKVLYDYMPTQPDELRLIVGEMVYITDKNLDDEGWYKGECANTGAVGVFPDNFVEEVPEISINKSPSLQNQAFVKNKGQSSENLSPHHNQLAGSSLTNSSVSNSSSNNSLSKLAPVTKTMSMVAPAQSVAETTQPAVDPTRKSAVEYDEMSDELEDNNKLIHIKKTKQMNKRPPSFRKKKDLPAQPPQAAADSKLEPARAVSADIELESVSSKLDIMNVSAVEETVKEAIVVKSNNLEVPKVTMTSPIPQQAVTQVTRSMSPLGKTNPSLSVTRQGTNLSGAGGPSDMSMATTMTAVDATQSTLMAGSVERLEKEVGVLREELAVARSENQGLQVELSTFKNQHDEQVKKLQLQLLGLVGEIDEEKKTRLAMQVELERLKKTIMTNL